MQPELSVRLYVFYWEYICMHRLEELSSEEGCIAWIKRHNSITSPWMRFDRQTTQDAQIRGGEGGEKSCRVWMWAASYLVAFRR